MTQPPGIGELVYLASCMLKVTSTAITTMTDTPNQYGANIAVVGDPGGWDLDPLTGKQGRNGNLYFALRNAYDVDPTTPIVNTQAELPDDLSDSLVDIGKYWVLDTLDDFGHVIMTTAHVWYGTSFRRFMTGSFGPPGPVPDVRLSCREIAPDLEPIVLTSGPSRRPSWIFDLPVPLGPIGDPTRFGDFPDVDEITNLPQEFNILGTIGDVTEDGDPIFIPLRIETGDVQVYSMPQGDFIPYIGISQQAPIGSFELPSQPFPWTPLVWGHLSAGGGAYGSLMIGAEVLLNDQTSGQMIARGFGNPLGEINITPHYSTIQAPGSNITPQNGRAIIPADEPATIYVNLWNDGQLGFYTFWPSSSPSIFQQLLNALTEALGNPVATIENIVTALSNWPYAVGAELQLALDSVVNLIGGSPAVTAVNATIDVVAQALNNFAPLVAQVADALGLGVVTNLITAVEQQLSSWASEITSDLQSAIDGIARSFGIVGIGNPITAVAAQMATLQPALETLADLLVVNPMSNVISLLDTFAGAVTTTVQTALDNVVNVLGYVGVFHTIDEVHTILDDFQGALDGVANAIGITAIGNTVASIVNALTPWVVGIIDGALQLAMNTLVAFLGVTGIEATINMVLQLLLPLLGNILSQFTTDAQVFVQVVAINPPVSTFVGFDRSAILRGYSDLSATAVAKKFRFTGHLTGRGTLSAAARMYRIKETAALAGRGALTADVHT